MSTAPAASPERDLDDDKRLAQILYLLHALAPFTAWLLAVVAVILGWARRDRVRGTFLDSHFSWLARTFWWGLLGALACGVATVLLVVTILLVWLAWVPFTALFFWYLYRVVKGWLRLNDGLPAD